MEQVVVRALQEYSTKGGQVQVIIDDAIALSLSFEAISFKKNSHE